MINETNSFTTGFKKHIKSFSIDGIIDDLPEMLKKPCNHLVDETEKEVFLIGAIGVISGLLPNIKGQYSGKWISSNLFVYVLAGYGGGKGGLDYAKELGQQIHQSRKDKANTLMIDYLKNIEIYKKQLKQFNKTKGDSEEPPCKPAKPPMLMLFIPANNSKSGIQQLLEENEGKGIIFESEGDTLSDALKQDFGGFSDILRKAFHHENLSLFRRMNNELIDINNPELSVVLASTFDQLKILIPSIDNGLYSRFLYYELKQNNKFNNVFDDNREEYQQKFHSSGESFKSMFDKLEQLDTPIYILLSKEQKNRFIEIFSNKKANLIEEIDTTMAGTANRLAIIAFRIMMIFTALRAYGNDTLNNSITCSDIDFDNALTIVDRLEEHAKTVFDHLNGQPDKKLMAKDLHNAGNSFGEIAKIINVSKSSVYRWITGKK